MIMNEKFFYWLKGFLSDKKSLSEDQLHMLKDEMSLIEEVEEKELQNFRDKTSTQLELFDGFHTHAIKCLNPDNCGMPSTWHGVTPPQCNVCGAIGQMMFPRFDSGNYPEGTTHIDASNLQGNTQFRYDGAENKPHDE